VRLVAEAMAEDPWSVTVGWTRNQPRAHRLIWTLVVSMGQRTTTR